MIIDYQNETLIINLMNYDLNQPRSKKLPYWVYPECPRMNENLPRFNSGR